ncbi:MAG: hypothetical protein M1821_006298 [Bathelium mastoideum]|nr:MAG: hypothetical protein M1821_006298 [Bathelium mastoideum]
MVSFSCESCISEAQKYEGALYKEKKPKAKPQPKNPNTEQALVPHKAYVEDAPDLERNGAVAVVDVPPRAPSPPPAAAALESNQPVNVFDFLITENTSDAPKTSPLPADVSHDIDSQENQLVLADPPPEYTPSAHMPHMYSQGQPTPMDYGYSYGSTPLEPSFERYDSYADLPATNKFVTPAPKRERDTSSQRDGESDRKKGNKSEKKRKRNHVGSLDLSLARQASQDEIMTDAPPTLHSGLTGGLNRLMSRSGLPPSPEYSGDASGPSPTEPSRLKKERTKDDKKDKTKSKKEKSQKSSSRSQNADAQSRKTSASSTAPSSRHHRHHRSDRSSAPSHQADSPPRRHHRQHRPSNSPPTRRLKAIEYPTNSTSSAQQNQQTQLVPYQPDDRATHFLSFVTKGPDSERGYSINKALKRWHRERGTAEGGSQGGGGGKGGRSEKWDEEKELWKSLRMRRNERGEIVVFI